MHAIWFALKKELSERHMNNYLEQKLWVPLFSDSIRFTLQMHYIARISFLDLAGCWIDLYGMNYHRSGQRHILVILVMSLFRSYFFVQFILSLEPSLKVFFDNTSLTGMIGWGYKRIAKVDSLFVQKCAEPIILGSKYVYRFNISYVATINSFIYLLKNSGVWEYVMNL